MSVTLWHMFYTDLIGITEYLMLQMRCQNTNVIVTKRNCPLPTWQYLPLPTVFQTVVTELQMIHRLTSTNQQTPVSVLWVHIQ